MDLGDDLNAGESRREVRETRMPVALEAPEAPAASQQPDGRAIARRVRNAIARRLVRRLGTRSRTTATRNPSRFVRKGRPRIQVIDEDALVARFSSAGVRAIGDSYVAGEWTCDDLVRVLTPLAKWLRAATRAAPFRAWVALSTARRRVPTTSPEAAAANAGWHYDLPAAFFARFLDRSLTYSCAIFESADEPLEAAQARKRGRVISQLALQPGARVLEVGGGWGAMAADLAQHGLDVTCVNPSREQVRIASAQTSALGLAVEYFEVDYRSDRVGGDFDGAVSIEMLEAVGLGHVDDYFNAVAAALRSHAPFVVQFIHTGHHRMLWSTGRRTWITDRIFPGGQILSKRAVLASAHRAGFELEDEIELGADYAKTVRAWRDRFLDSQQALQAVGYSAAFLRTWDFYLAVCIAGFETEDIGCAQWTFRRS